MPELPDVEVFRRHVAATSLHRRIERTSLTEPRLLEDVTPQLLARRLKHAEFRSTRRHGKYLLIELAGAEDWLVLHFGMTGRPQFLKRGRPPPEYTRVLFEFSDGSRLAYQSLRLLGKVLLTDSPQQLIASKDLGPDALEIDRGPFTRRLAEKRGMIKSALMDQSTIAGLGNVYSDEILFQTGMHPATPAPSLDDDQRRELYRVMRRVLKTTIRHHAHPDELPRGYLLPHREGDGVCPQCGGKLTRIKISGRTAVVCARCQPQPA